MKVDRRTPIKDQDGFAIETEVINDSSDAIAMHPLFELCGLPIKEVSILGCTGITNASLLALSSFSSLVSLTFNSVSKSMTTDKLCNALSALRVLEHATIGLRDAFWLNGPRIIESLELPKLCTLNLQQFAHAAGDGIDDALESLAETCAGTLTDVTLWDAKISQPSRAISALRHCALTNLHWGVIAFPSALKLASTHFGSLKNLTLACFYPGLVRVVAEVCPNLISFETLVCHQWTSPVTDEEVLAICGVIDGVVGCPLLETLVLGDDAFLWGDEIGFRNANLTARCIEPIARGKLPRLKMLNMVGCTCVTKLSWDALKAARPQLKLYSPGTNLAQHFPDGDEIDEPVGADPAWLAF